MDLHSILLSDSEKPYGLRCRKNAGLLSGFSVIHVTQLRSPWRDLA